MKTYGLTLESGPKHRKTMVHVFELLGCVQTGPTSEEAVERTPEAISAYLRFLQRCGEKVDPEAAFDVRVDEHVTTGDWLGNGTLYANFAADEKKLSKAELERLLHRFDVLCDEVGAWAAGQSDARLDKTFDKGRTERDILLHMIGPVSGYLASALETAPGYSKIRKPAEEGELPLDEAFRQAAVFVRERVDQVPPGDRDHVRHLSGYDYTLRKALRRILEHTWEHYAELARRPNGPTF